jgi:hypothetical protein
VSDPEFDGDFEEVVDEWDFIEDDGAFDEAEDDVQYEW